MKAKSMSVNRNTVFDIIRSTLIAVIFSLIAVLILALVVKLTDISESVIMPIIQVIKIGSILGGCMLGIKEKSKGAIKGSINGLLYTAISVFIFLILNKKLDGNSFGVFDFIAGIVAGAISGIIAVNFRKK